MPDAFTGLVGLDLPVLSASALEDEGPKLKPDALEP